MSPIEIIKARDNVIRIICAEKGWKLEELNFEQILEIRQDERWKNPTSSPSIEEQV